MTQRKLHPLAAILPFSLLPDLEDSTRTTLDGATGRRRDMRDPDTTRKQYTLHRTNTMVHGRKHARHALAASSFVDHDMFESLSGGLHSTRTRPPCQQLPGDASRGDG